METDLNGLVADSAAAGIYVPSYILDALRLVRSWLQSVRAVAPLIEEINLLK